MNTISVTYAAALEYNISDTYVVTCFINIGKRLNFSLSRTIEHYKNIYDFNSHTKSL